MLFDIENDPHETTNLASQRADLLGQGLVRMDKWMAAQMGGAQRGDPFWGVSRGGGPLHANELNPNWRNYLVLRCFGPRNVDERLESVLVQLRGNTSHRSYCWMWDR